MLGLARAEAGGAPNAGVQAGAPAARDHVGDPPRHHALVCVVVAAQHQRHAVPAEQGHHQALLGAAGGMQARGVRRLVDGHDAHRFRGTPEGGAEEAKLGAGRRVVAIQHDHPHRPAGEGVPPARAREPSGRGAPPQVMITPRGAPGNAGPQQARLGTVKVRAGGASVGRIEVVAGRQDDVGGPRRVAAAHAPADGGLRGGTGAPVALHQHPDRVGRLRRGSPGRTCCGDDRSSDDGRAHHPAHAGTGGLRRRDPAFRPLRPVRAGARGPRRWSARPGRGQVPVPAAHAPGAPACAPRWRPHPRRPRIRARRCRGRCAWGRMLGPASAVTVRRARRHTTCRTRSSRCYSLPPAAAGKGLSIGPCPAARDPMHT